VRQRTWFAATRRAWTLSEAEEQEAFEAGEEAPDPTLTPDPTPTEGLRCFFLATWFASLCLDWLFELCCLL